MIRIIYTFLLYLAAPILLFGLYKSKPGKPAFGHRWKEHFGYCSPLKSKRPVWIHAVSVGEVIAASLLIKRLKQQHPTLPILLTTTTSTGAEQAEKLGELVEHRYMPLDFSWAVRRFIATVKPHAFLIMETELWPNTLSVVKQANVPITVLNARLSERSCLRYAKVQPVFDLLSSNIDHLLCQHQSDAERFLRLGLTAEQVSVTGSLKFDITIEDQIIKQATVLREYLGCNRPVWIAASTHQGEDEQVLNAFKQLQITHPTALLIIVPRHPERFNNVATLCQAKGFTVIRRTDKPPILANGNIGLENNTVYLGDTMGELLIMLQAADIAFIGGSLIGDKVGGHNLLEPAALAKPIITGASYFNFTDITQQLLENDGCKVCNNSQHLAEILSTWFDDPASRAVTGQQALHVVQRNQGAIAKTIGYIGQSLAL
jgi:3-deoxy-D-manno-octulosonic-acid transferase